MQGAKARLIIPAPSAACHGSPDEVQGGEVRPARRPLGWMRQAEKTTPGIGHEHHPAESRAVAARNRPSAARCAAAREESSAGQQYQRDRDRLITTQYRQKHRLHPKTTSLLHQRTRHRRESTFHACSSFRYCSRRPQSRAVGKIVNPDCSKSLPTPFIHDR